MMDDEITDAAHNCPPELAHSSCASDNKGGVLFLGNIYNSMTRFVGIFYSEFSLDLSTKLISIFYICVSLIDPEWFSIAPICLQVNKIQAMKQNNCTHV